MGARGGKLDIWGGKFAPNAEAAAEARIQRALAGEHYLLPEEGQWLAGRIVELQRELTALREANG
jgi:hypothetical protein